MSAQILRPFLILGLSVHLIWSCQSTTDLPPFHLLEAKISDIHAAFEAGSCDCQTLVSAYLRRIDSLDQSTGLNAITVVDPRAMEIARQKDSLFAATGTLSPLHCIPLIVKDNYDTQGLQTAAGSIALKGFEPDRDAYQVRVLKAAGAIVLAKSNMAEWAFSPRQTISSLAGETRNPYHLDHVPAGSSGGTAAAVATNFGAAGLGTDTGNSIRGPSSHNALVGFRSTLGLTSRHGIVPLYLRNDVGGPMARSVEDATRLLQVIAGYDPADPLTRYSEGKVPASYTQFLDTAGLRGARIGVLRHLSEAQPHPEVHALFEQALRDLERLGATLVDPLEVADFDSLRQGQWCATFEYDVNQYLASHGDRIPYSTIQEIFAAGKYAPYIETRLKYQIDHPGNPAEQDPPCLDPFTDPRRIAFREAIESAMDQHQVDALVYPTWNHPPARIGHTEEYEGDNSQVIAPHTGQPAFTVPMGYSSGNLPAGLQFLGRMFDEGSLIRLLYAYEQGTHHRKMPELFP